MPKRVVILGSTGSIGCAALEVAQALRDEITIVGLAAGENWRRLAEQAAAHRPCAVALASERDAESLRGLCPAGTRVLSGPQGLVDLVMETDADFVLSAIVGAAGLPATLAAVERGLTVGLANKESLVAAGALLMPAARAHGATLLPVDSEHSGVFQALYSGRPAEVRRIFLTASGGPFRTWPRERIDNAALEDALNHPTWSMGPKITIDSATMMNKALEIIEAQHLFGLRPEQIEVVIHPQSIVHAMVEFVDGSVIAQMGAPDMRTPIQYAMLHPRRVGGPSAALSVSALGRLDFEPPDFDRFPALRLGYSAARAGGSAGAVLNAANEAAVGLFRAGRIPFGAIARVAEQVLNRHECIAQPTLSQLMESDRWARSEVSACLGL